VAFALSMDAFAVSLCFGSNVENNKTAVSLKTGAFFGIFQAVMPLIGWAVGFYLKEFIQQVDHWIAFVLLTIIGARMLREAIKNRNCQKKINTDNILVMLSLSVATSIDALAVGLSFALLKIPILLAVSIIGVVTFFMSYLGVHLGKKINYLLGNKAEIAGGIVLILIGIKILVEHLFFQ
jgi:putative Mn2+ efflux pump MntP